MLCTSGWSVLGNGTRYHQFLALSTGIENRENLGTSSTVGPRIPMSVFSTNVGSHYLLVSKLCVPNLLFRPTWILFFTPFLRILSVHYLNKFIPNSHKIWLCSFLTSIILIKSSYCKFILVSYSVLIKNTKTTYNSGSKQNFYSKLTGFLYISF